jgi:hypothetical protein
MTKILKPASKGDARIEHFTVSKQDAAFQAMRGDCIAPGTYARIYADGELMMSDTDMERRSNWTFAHKAHGRVLIAGLGLGMILTGMDQAKVTDVTVVEKSQDVIDLVGPHFPKVRTICADILAWQPPKGEKWNTIYFDIWPHICTDNLKDMAVLHRRFASRLDRSDPDAWMGSWMRDVLKARQRRGGY